jgi:hypothetical protein
MLRRLLIIGDHLGTWPYFIVVMTLVSLVIIPVFVILLYSYLALARLMEPVPGAVLAAFQLVRSALPHTETGWLWLFGAIVFWRFHWLLSEIEQHLRQLKSRR